MRIADAIFDTSTAAILNVEQSLKLGWMPPETARFTTLRPLQWRLENDLNEAREMFGFWTFTLDKEPYLLLMKPGFRWSASIPKLVPRWILDESDWEVYFPSAPHDLLYQLQPSILGGRAQADRIMIEAMASPGVSASWRKRLYVRAALKLGGWHAWNQHKRVPVT